MKKILLPILLLCCLAASAQDKEETEIKKLLQTQISAWNRGDLEAFMQTYWKNDSLLFIGKSGVTRGWNSTLANYKRGYPDAAAMGKLSFDIIEVKSLSSHYYFVVGKWMLDRAAGNLNGHFSLLMQKIDGAWKIIADHSS